MGPAHEFSPLYTLVILLASRIVNVVLCLIVIKRYQFQFHNLVSNPVVNGDKRPYHVALIVLRQVSFCSGLDSGMTCAELLRLAGYHSFSGGL